MFGSSPAVSPQVTVIVTAYGRLRFLTDALASIAAQTTGPTDLETIVATDGTTPEIDAAARRIAAKVLIVPERAQGVKIDRALAASSAPLVAFLDDDDLWRPEKIASALDEFQRDPELGYYAHGLAIIDELGRATESGPYRVMSHYAHSADLGGREGIRLAPGARAEADVWRAERVNTWNCSSVVVRRSILEPYRPELRQLVRPLDAFLLYTALLSRTAIRFDRRVLTSYRVHSQNNMWISSGSRAEQLAKYVRTLREWEDGAALLVSMAERESDAGPVLASLQADLEVKRTFRKIASRELPRNEAARALLRHLGGSDLWRRHIPWPKRIALSEAACVLSPRIGEGLNLIWEQRRAQG